MQFLKQEALFAFSLSVLLKLTSMHTSQAKHFFKHLGLTTYMLYMCTVVISMSFKHGLHLILPLFFLI